MNALKQLQARWKALEARERQLVALCAGLIGLALVWWIVFAPALKTLRQAPAEHAKLDAQLQQMTTLQAQAKALQAQPRANREEATKALESSVHAGLGPSSQMQQQGGGEGVNVVIRGVSAEALATWLAQARGNARAVPREVHLTRSGGAAPASAPPAAPASPAAAPAAAGAAGAAAGAAGAARTGGPSASAPAPTNASDKANWDGTLVMSLPAAR
ncbi:MAG: type II secretion system protein M [Proteobacteria bacterium]|nr:type II secretion system protein M [Pseudomonadota bacterium]